MTVKLIRKEKDGVKSRLYFHPANFNPIKDLVTGERFNRPRDEYRKLLPEVMEKAGLPATMKAAWSQKAGCSCGCSPGFVLDADRYAFRFDVHVELDAQHDDVPEQPVFDPSGFSLGGSGRPVSGS